ncbi:hypothetical protein M0805_009053 [Coniferiporia weirii]|nr:hypothetical protein M0805_009053 [Coniferiporia weirii]
MPLDGHSYLVAQGWSGKGSGLRQGGIARPLAIPQKRTLAGLGKDRDEAFPFWDHLFSVAAKTIQVKIHKDGDDDSSNTDADTPSLPALTRTSTGLLSNKRPLTCTSVSLGETSSSADAPRMSLLATAKRDAARKGLYARFFRGPVIGPDLDSDEKIASTSTTISEVLVPSIAPAIVVQDREVELAEKPRKEKRSDRKKKEKSGRTNEDKEKKRDKKGKKKEEERVEDGLCESGNVTADERKGKHASSKDGKDREKKKAKKRKREAEDVSPDAEGTGSFKGQIKERGQEDDKKTKSKKRRKEDQSEKKDEGGEGGGEDSDNLNTDPADLKRKRKVKSSKIKSSSSEKKVRKGDAEVKKESGRKRERKDVKDASNDSE